MSTVQWVGAGFVLLLIGFLFYAYIRPQKPGPGQTDIIRFVCALCAGFAGGLFVGDALFKLDSTITATKIGVTGSAGFAFAFVVWYGYGRTLLPDGYSFSVPENWTFEQAARAMVQEDHGVIDFKGFEPSELSAALRPAQVSRKTLKDALRALGGIAKSQVRDYDVSTNPPNYVLTVKA